jgi:hypothetical protein
MIQAGKKSGSGEASAQVDSMSVTGVCTLLYPAVFGKQNLPTLVVMATVKG